MPHNRVRSSSIMEPGNSFSENRSARGRTLLDSRSFGEFVVLRGGLERARETFAVVFSSDEAISKRCETLRNTGKIPISKASNIAQIASLGSWRPDPEGFDIARHAGGGERADTDWTRGGTAN